MELQYQKTAILCPSARRGPPAGLQGLCQTGGASVPHPILLTQGMGDILADLQHWCELLSTEISAATL